MSKIVDWSYRICFITVCYFQTVSTFSIKLDQNLHQVTCRFWLHLTYIMRSCRLKLNNYIVVWYGERWISKLNIKYVPNRERRRFAAPFLPLSLCEKTDHRFETIQNRFYFVVAKFNLLKLSILPKQIIFTIYIDTWNDLSSTLNENIDFEIGWKTWNHQYIV